MLCLKNDISHPLDSDPSIVINRIITMYGHKFRTVLIDFLNIKIKNKHKNKNKIKIISDSKGTSIILKLVHANGICVLLRQSVA